MGMGGNGNVESHSRTSLLRTEVYSAFHPSGVGKWVPAAAGKAKAGTAHSTYCGWTCGCAGKTVKSLENACHTWALLRWCFTTKSSYIKCMYLNVVTILSTGRVTNTVQNATKRIETRAVMFHTDSHRGNQSGRGVDPVRLGVLTSWKYVGGVRICFNPPKMSHSFVQNCC